MGQQQIILVILAIIVVGLAIAIGLSLFASQHTESSRDAIINDLNHLGAVAYQFRSALRVMSGGEGSYSTFAVPSQLRSNENGIYSIQAASQNQITFTGVAFGNPSNTIVVTVDSYGNLMNWTYGGDFQ